MEKHDYVICSWCGLDIVPNFEYDYLFNVTHNEAVWEAKFRSDQQTLHDYKNLIYEELDKRLGGDGFAIKGFSDVYEEIMSEFQRFEVWEVLPETPKEAYDEYDFNPDLFCSHWCKRVA